MALLSLYTSMMFLVASVFAVKGTNAQARLAKRRLLEDRNPLLAKAGQMWRPSRWLCTPTFRRERTKVEEELKADPETWQRFQTLRTELIAWNALETSVALAFGASLASVISLLPGI